MNQDQTIISISDYTDIREGWRVRAFILPADWNALGRTLAERRNIRTEKAARTYAAELLRRYPGATVQG